MTRSVLSSMHLFVLMGCCYKLHYLIFVICWLLWTLGNDDKIKTDWKVTSNAEIIHLHVSLIPFLTGYDLCFSYFIIYILLLSSLA